MFEIEILNQNLGKIKRPKHFDQWVKVRDTMFVHTRGKKSWIDSHIQKAK